MERSKILTEKVSDYKNAIDSFSIAIDLDLSKYKNIELDLLKNGQIQKFEYVLELCWKILKFFLNEIHGIESVSPKSAIKEFFGIGMIDEAEY
ncbi:MAG TPA: nucleotidyltransferase substrate binding protein [Ignavibacteriaceae bacterium]|nr:nucleotidyltransferase substrate binding protein [Ignavibacteriaceae bacterium]